MQVTLLIFQLQESHMVYFIGHGDGDFSHVYVIIMHKYFDKKSIMQKMST
jgi:hypothetical protein